MPTWQSWGHFGGNGLDSQSLKWYLQNCIKQR